MGKRARRRGQRERLSAPSASYTSPDGDVLVLRGTLTARTQMEYGALLAGSSGASAAATREDLWARAGEFLFERLAVRWDVADVSYHRQDELLARFRMASGAERAWVLAQLRSHVSEWFPELEAP
jgi:hypothetical protein